MVDVWVNLAKLPWWSSYSEELNRVSREGKNPMSVTDGCSASIDTSWGPAHPSRKRILDHQGCYARWSIEGIGFVEPRKIQFHGSNVCMVNRKKCVVVNDLGICGWTYQFERRVIEIVDCVFLQWKWAWGWVQRGGIVAGGGWIPWPWAVGFVGMPIPSGERWLHQRRELGSPQPWLKAQWKHLWYATDLLLQGNWRLARLWGTSASCKRVRTKEKTGKKKKRRE